MDEKTRAVLRGFILDNYLFGDESRLPGADDSLLRTGVLDSTGVLELIEFLEQEFGIAVAETETVPENLDSIDAITRYLASKRQVAEGSS